VIFEALPVHARSEEHTRSVWVDGHQQLIRKIYVTAHQVPPLLLWHRVEDGQLLVQGINGVPQAVIVLLVELVRVIVHTALGLVHPLLAINQLLETLPLHHQKRPAGFLGVFELLQVDDLLSQAFDIPQEVFLVKI
jgi:hypothetical protein